MIIVDIPQGSDEWFLEKLGKPSSSNFSKIVTSKGDPSKQSKDYLYRLAGELVSGVPTETYSSAAMERGVMMEEEARGMFQIVKEIDIEQVGVVYPDKKKKYLCSPDSIGLLANKGLEIKCPLVHTHVGYLLANKLPTKYIAQVQGSMLVTGYDSWWFMSYYPILPPLIIEVERDEEFIGKLKDQLDVFYKELKKITKKLRELK